MYLVNQTETVAVNIVNQSKIEVVDDCIVSSTAGDSQIILGRYGNYERACEVFNSILQVIGREGNQDGLRYMPKS